MEKPKLPQAARLLLHMALLKPRIAALIGWLDDERNADEEMELLEWTEHFWYIQIKDRTVTSGYPGNIMIGFTVDLDGDRIFWSNQKEWYNGRFPNGGNCFCRSEKWFRKLYRAYPVEAVSDRKDPERGTVHDYRPRKQAV